MNRGRDFFFTLILQFSSIGAALAYQILIVLQIGLSDSLANFFLVFSSFSFLHVVSTTYISTVLLSSGGKLPLKYFQPSFIFLFAINTLVFFYFLCLKDFEVSSFHIFLMWTSFLFVFYNAYSTFSEVAERKTVFFSMLVPFLQQIFNIIFFLALRFMSNDDSILFEVNFFSMFFIFLFSFSRRFGDRKAYFLLSSENSARQIFDLFYNLILFSPFLLAPVVINHYLHILDLENRSSFYYIFTIVSFLSVLISHFQTIDVFISSAFNRKKFLKFSLFIFACVCLAYITSLLILESFLEFITSLLGFSQFKYMVFMDYVFLILVLSSLIGIANVIRSRLLRLKLKTKFGILISLVFFVCLFCGFALFRDRGMLGVLLSYFLAFIFYVVFAITYVIKTDSEF